jgi:integrating conjugative element protein (TIGR03749 family)
VKLWKNRRSKLAGGTGNTQLPQDWVSSLCAVVAGVFLCATSPLGLAQMAPSPATPPHAKPAPPAAKPSPGKPAAAAPAASSASEGTVSISDTPVRLIWNRAPLPLGLHVGTERMITFPAPVRLGIPPEIAPFVRAQIVDRTAYIVTSAPFYKARIVAENPINGTVILLDVSALRTGAATAPVEIFLDKKPERDAIAVRRPKNDDEEPVPEVDQVSLTRYAAQQLYAPRRLIKELPGVRQVQLDLSPVIGLYRNAMIKAEPVGGWRSPEHFVTAVKLTNTGSLPIELDPRELRGQWRTATFQHTRILAAGTEEDTTVVYLVSDRRFEETR